MFYILLTIVLFNIGFVVNSTSEASKDEGLDIVRTAEQMKRQGYMQRIITTDILIKNAGFEPEVHRVVTDDGYILRLTRITTFRKGPIGPPVLIVHGLFMASDALLQRGRKEDLAFILADKGFDIWLADLRGNLFSHEHEFLKSTDPEFWNFSFHEIGVYDLPAFIIEILANSLYSKIFYIGYSLGTNAFFCLTSTRPEFNNYIQTAIMLSPVTFGKRDFKSTLIKQALKVADNITSILNKAGVYEILSRSPLLELFIRVACDTPLQVACLNFMGSIYGEDRKNLNKAKTGDYLVSSSSGTSLKTITHFTQIFNTGEFKQFDYGVIENMKIYGQPKPPFYNLNLVSSPVTLFYSDNDRYTGTETVEKLERLLPNVIYKQELPHYSHLDYIYGNNAPSILYNKIVNIFQGDIP